METEGAKLKIPPATNREIRMGSLEEIQGCVERGLEALNVLEITYDAPSETRSSTVYQFRHGVAGNIGEVKLSRLGENTELYFFPPMEPNDEEAKEFLLRHVDPSLLEESLRALLSQYREEKILGIANLEPEKKIALGLQADAPRIDPAKYGLNNLEKVQAANQALESWRQKIRIRRNDEFTLVRSAIVGQLNQEKILPVLENGEPKKNTKSAGKFGDIIKEPPKTPEPKSKGGNIDLWLDWYHKMTDNGFKCTLKEVAEKSGYSLGYIKQKHMVYRASIKTDS